MRALTRVVLALSVGALVVSTARATAQDLGDAVAYSALVLTPTAGVAPVARQWTLSEPRTGTGFGF